ncbi:MAG: hypothetical protein AB7Y46_11170, partial [Armatimonadota bacterium]
MTIVALICTTAASALAQRPGGEVGGQSWHYVGTSANKCFVTLATPHCCVKSLLHFEMSGLPGAGWWVVSAGGAEGGRSPSGAPPAARPQPVRSLPISDSFW